MSEIKCLFCQGKHPFRTVYESNWDSSANLQEAFQAKKKNKQIHNGFVRCSECELLFAKKILPQEEIAKLYTDSEMIYGNEEQNILATYSKYFNSYAHLLKAKSRALEIGCGSGFFLAYLKQWGFQNVVGVEPSKSAIDNAPKELQPHLKCADFHSLSKEELGKFDLVCLFQTIEHVINPQETINKIYDLLNPGGMIFIISHNEKALSASLLKDQSPIIDIQHIYLFNKKTIGRLIEGTGFQINNQFTVWNTYTLRYWLSLLPWSQLQSLISPNISERVKLSLPPGNMGIVASKVISN